MMLFRIHIPGWVPLERLLAVAALALLRRVPALLLFLVVAALIFMSSSMR